MVNMTKNGVTDLFGFFFFLACCLFVVCLFLCCFVLKVSGQKIQWTGKLLYKEYSNVLMYITV